MAVWAAKRVQHLARERDAAVVAAAIKAAEDWADEPNAANAAKAAVVAYAASNAADANAAYAAAVYANAASEARIEFLSDLIDEYDRLTGRTQYEPVDMARLQADYKTLAGAR